MPVESATYISDLNASYPQAGDSPVDGDNHIRLVKSVTKATFPNVTGAVTPTHTELNYVDGVTSSIQTQINDITSKYSLRFISSASASNSATIDFTSGIDSTYDEYELHIINAISATGAIPWLRTSTDAGSSFASTSGDYTWISGRMNGTSFTVTNDGGTATSIVLHNQAIATANAGYSAVVKFYQPSSTSVHKVFNVTGGGLSASAREASFTTGIRPATAAINAIRFMFASGNVTSGEFKLYGLKKSA